MAQPAATTTDRLPWLTEVPRAPPREKKGRRFPWEWVVAGLLVLLLGLGGYWLGTRVTDEAGEAASPPTEKLAQAAPGDEMAGIPSVSDMTEGDQLAAEPIETPAETAPRPRQADQPVRRQRPRQTQSSEEPESMQAAPVPAVTIPAQPVVRGRIIQIGAYPNRAQADVAWEYVVKRWPYLASKPKLVSPIEVRSTDGKGTRMYRLQLATSSQAQSAVICQRLETAKVSCVVVY